jgi:BirA family transcriptional regulator, biotin operon repressor / biotin---[acetyl-CoA-carboxylase] ligase
MPCSPEAFALLRRLADGELHSGAKLAAGIGLTRARVSQLLEQAEDAGFALERVRGRGYRLIDAVPFLDRNAILGALRARAPGLTIEVVDSIDSTNSELLRRTPGRDVHRYLLAAEWQSAGRGRRGRPWIAVAGGSLTFSLGWRFEQGVGLLSALPLAIGVAIVRALESAGLRGVELKWPNDLVHDERKLGGILIELAGDALGPSVVAIGVGINVQVPQSVLRTIAQPVTDLASIAPVPDRNSLIADIAAEMTTVLDRYASEGFGAFRAEWLRRHALRNLAVEILLPDGGAVRGVVAGVDELGALLLECDGRRRRFVSGEVSVRRAHR